MEIRNPPLVWCLLLIGALIFAGGAWLAVRPSFISPVSLAKQRLRIIGNSMSYAGTSDIADIHDIQVIIPDNISNEIAKNILIDPSDNAKFKLTRDYSVDGPLSESIIFSGPFGVSRLAEGHEYIILTKDYKVEQVKSASFPVRVKAVSGPVK